MLVLASLLIGVVAGLRTMTAPAAVAVAAWLGWIDLSATWAWFLASAWVVAILSAAALGELVVDKLPSTPSRKVPQQFGARLVTGGLSGAALGAAAGLAIPGLIAGLLGAAIGTYAGAAARARLAAAFGADRPAALTEDAVAVLGALLIVSQA